MRPFMNSDFLLTTDTAKRLYHEAAETMPIIDYHCHISPRQIAENQPLRDIAEVWLGGDHYKWRVMRAANISKEYITGRASGLEKFKAFASVMPQLIGNPIYHWSHLELQRGFGIYEPLTPANAEDIYHRCNAVLAHTTPRDLMHKFGVKALCTTDDPCDDLSWHEVIRNDPDMDVQVLPAFRPDAYINMEKDTFLPALARLSETVGKPLLRAQDVADQKVLAELGPCDILVNGAGGNNPRATTDNEYQHEAKEGQKTFFDLDASGVDFVFKLNFQGTLMPTQTFAKDMVERKCGNILNISSMNAYIPLTKIPAYSGAKAAISNFTQWLATHFAGCGIRANAIAPGFLVSNQNRALLFNPDGSLTARSAKILNGTPTGRFVDSEELLGGVFFLTDDHAASAITGVVLPIDAGFAAYSGV